MASDIETSMSPLSTEKAEREFVRLLISLYRENPHLWDNKDPHYLHKMRRVRTLKNICDTLKVYRPDYTTEHLKKKINILRTNFNKELHKIETKKAADMKDGVMDSDPEPGLWYYNELMFLADQKRPPPPRPIMSIPPTSHPKLMYQPLQKKIKLPDPPAPCLKNQENEADFIAKCWAMKLLRLDPNQRIYAEKIINDTLFEAAMGTLTRHGASFVAEPSFVECSNEESHSPRVKVSPSD